ncbi:voltage-dependent anion channel-domain-containing protein [Cercophora scortea]|uniref:Voltage-dependent anion channel-domain-containing protein n=1 Tax=Cercophora scortea TaxID=314031 RepID=A0AAE0M6I5_9PEZI|nr:voltage-dependent anion channel-domain-containing protein [Cercophora scortea]
MTMSDVLTGTLLELIIFLATLAHFSEATGRLEAVEGNEPSFLVPLYILHRLFAPWPPPCAATATATTAAAAGVHGGGGGGGYESPEDDAPPSPSPYPPSFPPEYGSSNGGPPSSSSSRPGRANGAVSSTCGGHGHSTSYSSSAGGGGAAAAAPCSSLDGILSKARARGLSPNGRRKVGIRDRIACYRWTWFTMTMATGGVANLLYSIPYRSQWLTGLGLAFFFLNMCLFVMNCVLITLRFRWRPGSLVNSFTDQLESLFVPAVIVSAATILITICQYGVPHAGPWLLQAMEAMFWIYISASTFASAGMYLTLWSTQVFPIHTMTPVWVFPAYPLLLTAPFGGNLIAAAVNTGQLSSINTVAITMASVTVQGTGFLISFMVCAAFLYRLMTQKLPRDAQRPGVFISIGPSGFTAAGLVQLGYHTTDIFPTNFMGTQHAVYILRLLAYVTGLWLWGLSIWFFLVSVGSLWKYLRPEHRSKMSFQMTWFSFVFPNTALVAATEQLGRAFESPGLQICGCVLAGCIVLVWVLVFGCMIKCLWKRELLWPKDDD